MNTPRKITYKSITTIPKDAALPENINKFGEFLGICDEPDADNTVCTALYLFPHIEKTYKVLVHLDKTYRSMSQVFNDILRDALSADDVDGMIDGDPDFIRVLNIVAGQLAAKDIRIDNHDPRVELQFQMVSGQTFYVDRKSIDWKKNSESMGDMGAAIAQLKSAIFMLASANEAEYEENKENLLKYIATFHEQHNMNPDYGYLDSAAEVSILTPERYSTTIKLVDMMVVIYEILAATIDMTAMQAIRSMINANTIEPVNETPAEDGGEEGNVVIEEETPDEDTTETAEN